MKLDEMFKKTPEVKTGAVSSAPKPNEQPIVNLTSSLKDDADLVEASKSYGLGDNVSLEWLDYIRRTNPSAYANLKNWD